MDQGRWRRTAAGLMTLEIGKGPTNWGLPGFHPQGKFTRFGLGGGGKWGFGADWHSSGSGWRYRGLWSGLSSGVATHYLDLGGVHLDQWGRILLILCHGHPEFMLPLLLPLDVGPIPGSTRELWDNEDHSGTLWWEGRGGRSLRFKLKKIMQMDNRQTEEVTGPLSEEDYLTRKRRKWSIYTAGILREVGRGEQWGSQVMGNGGVGKKQGLLLVRRGGR